MEALCCTHKVPRTILLAQLGLSYDSFLRWKRRIKAGAEPVCCPGPKKLELINLAGLRQAIANLKHTRKRTHDTGGLYRHYGSQVSRRQLAAMVVEARKEHTGRLRAVYAKDLLASPGSSLGH